jgi:hypothetical protein
MLQLLDLARENAALKRQLAKMLAELEEAQQCLAVIPEAWADDRTCSSFESEPGESEPAFWPALTEHVKRRDGIVHRGLHVSKPEAQASREAVAGLIEYLKRKHNVG